MKFERNKSSRKYFLCGLIMVVVLTVTVTFITSKANYRMTASIPLTEGKVVSSPYDLNIVAMYIDGVEQSNDTIIPKGYKINEEDSYCYKTVKSDKDTNARLYTDEQGNYVFSGISKSSKCILYLKTLNNNQGSAGEYILSHINNINIRRNDYLPFNETVTGDNAPTEKTIYKAYDNDGITYYYAGNPTDNWVLFGGYYWRIIRINGDGSIRMIYQGIEANTTGVGTQIGTSAFNENYNDNAYVGYMYRTPNSSTYEATHANVNSSTIKTYIDNWFQNSALYTNANYYNKIDLNAVFCGDRAAYSSSALTSTSPYNKGPVGGGTGTTATFYGAYLRLRPRGISPTLSTTTITPTFTCVDKDDLYTYSLSNEPGKLNNPVGLITADELSYAGMVYDSNAATTKNYLYTGQSYWTMSPSEYPNALVFFVASVGHISNYSTVINSPRGIRPVINLRSDTLFTGDGTISNPYKVV
ncbi:MAG: hypothetical protein NC483_04470 [Ruminococcus sp.]|nr:hypothetical protein [Ruminococcus sp.]